MTLARLAALLVGLIWPLTAPAQIASLVADSVAIDADRVLTAEGNVEVFYEGARLTARRVRYDQAADRLTIEGPLTLYDGESVVVVATAADLDPDLANGVLRSARLVLDRQLQLAAAQINRVGGRYTQLRRAVASSCEVCAADPTPLWEIRADSVIHDQLERQLYFENATIRVAGLPVFYVPRLRLPDPTLDRATGFLIPRIRTSTRLSTGLKFPYFITLGQSADVTLTPYLSSRTRTLEGRYRQAFRNGRITLDGAFTPDDAIRPGETRAYLFGRGSFLLPRDYRLSFDIELVSDPAYLLDYGYSSKDRLDSAIAVGRTRDDEQIGASYTWFRTLREADLDFEDELPDRLGEFEFTRRVPTGPLGGDAWLTLDAFALSRQSTDDVVGRDFLRLGAAADWRRDWRLPRGALVTARAGLAVQAYTVADDSTLETNPIRTVPSLSVELRWPLIRTDRDGVTQTLEPVAQIVWSESFGDRTPNEDSLLVEFDEGNLFDLSRFPGSDAYEEGLRANLGVTWWRRDPSGLALGVTIGRIVRFDAPDQFADGTGLEGDLSDWLTAVQLRMGNRLTLLNRALFDDTLSFSRNETRLDWRADWGRLSTSYTWSDEIPAENRVETLSEWSFDAFYDLNRHWRARVDWRYDLIAERAAQAGVGLGYRNECLGVEFSASRRFTSSTTVAPITDFDIRFTINGFGTNGDGERYRRICAG